MVSTVTTNGNIFRHLFYQWTELYGWVGNNSSLSRTYVDRSTEPHLARFLILICREHKNMSRAFSGTVSPCCLFSHCWLSIAKYKTWSTSCSDKSFFVFQFADDVRDAYAKKTADEIPVEANCWQFLQGASAWAAWGARFPRFIGRQRKQRRADSGLFRIHPRAPPPAGGFSKFIFVADKIIFKIGYSICFDYFSNFSPISRPKMETKACQFGTISDSATSSTYCR